MVTGSGGVIEDTKIAINGFGRLMIAEARLWWHGAGNDVATESRFVEVRRGTIGGLSLLTASTGSERKGVKGGES